MARVRPLQRQDLADFEPIFQLIELRMGYLPTDILTLGRRPEILYGFLMLSGAVFGMDGGLPRLLMLKLALKNMIWAIRRRTNAQKSISQDLKYLIAFVASRAAGCSYCEAHTGLETIHSGVAIEKLEEVWEFETSPLFSEAEKTALRLAAACGAVPNEATDEHFQALGKHFNESQIIQIVAVIALFGFLNRWNETLAADLEELPLTFARKHLAEGGWEAGIHMPPDWASGSPAARRASGTLARGRSVPTRRRYPPR